MKSLVLAMVIGIISLSSQAAFVGIHAAAATGDMPALTKYLADDPASISSRNGAGRTPLCVAAMRGQTNAVAFLISRGADVNDKGFEDMTPLADMAAPWGLRNDEKCAEIAALLLAHGAKVDPTDAYGETPLLWAAQSNKPELVQFLLEHGADVRMRAQRAGKKGDTALHLAIGNRQTEVVKVLLKFKAPLDLEESSGWTPLALAERLGQEDVADLIRATARQSGQDVPEPPSRAAMRALGKRVAKGEAGAFDELVQISKTLYQGINYQNDRGRAMANLYRMSAAFGVLGQEAGRGNGVALAALKKSLTEPHLKAFAPDALGVAAAGSNKEALDMLLHYEKWGILESSAIFALAHPVKAGVGPAIDWAATWLSTVQPKVSAGFIMSTTNALGDAAANGNADAARALKEFRVISSGWDHSH